jgi:hypothetical protein
MEMAAKAFKGNLQELAFIGWMLESPEKRFATFFSRSGGVSLFERALQREDGLWTVRRISGLDPRPEDGETLARFGGRLKLDEYGLRNAGLVATASAATTSAEERMRFESYLADINLDGGRWVYNSVLATLTPKAAEWWESEGKARYERQLAKLHDKKAAEKAKERVAVFGVRQTYDGTEYAGTHAGTVGRVGEILGIANSIVPKWRGMRPAFSAVIVRETETRYYIRDAKKLTGAYLLVEGAMTRNNDGRYVDKDKLILDNATDADIARLRAFDDTVSEEYSEMRDKLLDDLVPVLLNAIERNVQKSAEIDGTFAEMLAAMTKNKE